MAQFDFITVITADPEIASLGGHSTVGFWAIVEGKLGQPDECIDDCFDTEIAAERAGREYKALMIQHAREWQHEIAMEEGMLQGVDAYNEIMGY